jgi:hypothetical protein
MAGGKGKSVGGKATGAKDSGNKTQKSHSAKAGLQVSSHCHFACSGGTRLRVVVPRRKALESRRVQMKSEVGGDNESILRPKALRDVHTASKHAFALPIRQAPTRQARHRIPITQYRAGQ